MTPMEIAVERYRSTRARYGVALPVVDAEAPDLIGRLPVEADALALWIVKLHPELAAFEIIVEEVAGEGITVLFAGMTHGGGRRFHEHRIAVAIAIEEDTTYYVDRPVFTVLSSTQITDESDLVRIRTPRWQLRAAEPGRSR